jgi:hypothetical protein
MYIVDLITTLVSFFHMDTKPFYLSQNYFFKPKCLTNVGKSYSTFHTKSLNLRQNFWPSLNALAFNESLHLKFWPR